MRAIYWLAKKDIATVKYDSLLSFLDEAGLESVKNLRVRGNATYRSHQSAEGMQDAIATDEKKSGHQELNFSCLYMITFLVLLYKDHLRKNAFVGLPTVMNVKKRLNKN